MAIVYDDIISNLDTDNVYRYILNDIYSVNDIYAEFHANPIPNIKKVLFRPPATIVFWSDNTKTVVKAEDGDEYDAEKGLAMAISKKTLDNKGNYYNVFDKWLSEAPSYCSNWKPLRTSLDQEIESKKDGDNIEKTCDNCKYGELTWYDEPCEDCLGRTMYWEPID